MESSSSPVPPPVLPAADAVVDAAHAEDAEHVPVTSTTTEADQHAIHDQNTPDEPAAAADTAAPTAIMTASTTESSTPIATPATPPACVITLLLTSGARHPYKIDEKYLTKRNVDMPGLTESGHKDPFSISVYTLKELILREWRDDWAQQPAHPSSIRLIHFGRLLDDKAPLKECRFNVDAPNVVHMTVKPQELIDEDDNTKGKSVGRDRYTSEATAGCRCIMI